MISDTTQNPADAIHPRFDDEDDQVPVSEEAAQWAKDALAEYRERQNLRESEGLKEALAWLKEAEELLDQAHANLKALGLHNTTARCSVYASRQPDIMQIVKEVRSLIAEIKEEAL